MNFLMTHLKEIEYIVLIVIAILQVRFFFGTKKIISDFANIFSKKPFTLDGELLDKTKEYSKIVAHINQSAFRKKEQDAEEQSWSFLEESFTLFGDTEPEKEPLDFIEVRRITEEHLDRQEDAINRSITIPLYLGLMGTILGIIFGLFAYGYTSVTEQMPIDEIINAVKIAMTVSFLGLLLTVLNQTRTFSKAKARLEAGKEEFYKYLKDEYKPFENEFAPVIAEMTEGLAKFNKNFGKNLEKMATAYETAKEVAKCDFSSLGKSLDKFKTVEAYLEKIKNLLDKVTEQESTVNKVKTLQEATTHLDNNITIFGEATSKIVNSVEGNKNILRELFEYFDSEKFAEMQNKVIEEHQQVTKTLTSHLSEQKTELEKAKKESSNFLEEVQNDLTKTSVTLKNEIAEFTKIASSRFAELDNQIVKTNIEIATAFSKLAKDLDLKGVTKEDLLNTAIVGQMENVSKAIAESFGQIQKSMGQWESQMAESIKEGVKADVKKAAKEQEEQTTNLTQMAKILENQQQLLEKICENTKQRSFWRSLIG